MRVNLSKNKRQKKIEETEMSPSTWPRVRVYESHDVHGQIQYTLSIIY